ncbi:TcfC E-set like domain-containing protein [Vibrio owensii]|uniref:TcfC E-set like domain-containing protein n=1 Tax=Vibrio owensii TaxID=696485 RepID=UPI0003A2CE53|nr:TcfC E-set like domain-containing protein [Vibrio owensii]
MNIKLHYAMFSIIIALHFYPTKIALAAFIPSGFEGHFETKEIEVKFRNLDGTFSNPIKVLSSFDKIRIDKKNKKSISHLETYLEENKISKTHQEDIIRQLILGVEDESQCLGKIENCKLYPETFEIVQNYNEQEVYLFVSPTILDLNNSQGNVQYHAAQSDNNGVINSFDLYVSAYQNSDSVVSLNDEVTLGLPYGYLKSDFNLTNSSQGSVLYEAAYHLDVDAYSFKAGHFEYDPNVNSTDYLNNTARMAQNSVTFGSSEKLLIGGQKSDKVLSFYVPSSGFVKVYRDDRIIYQSNVASGQQSIAYTELPSGRYEARLEVSVNGQVVNTQLFQVYNSTNDVLTEGSFDYTLSAGLLAESYFDYENTGIAEIDNDAYGKGLVNYQATESLQLGGGTLVTDSSTMFSVGGNFGLLSTGLMVEGVHSQFDDASYTNVNLALNFISLSYDNLDNAAGDPLATHIHGSADYSRWSLNSYYNLGQGRSIYATYTWNEETLLADNDGFSDLERDGNLISVGYTTPTILDSILNVNFDYSDYDDDKSISLLWSVPLSDTMEASVSTTSNTEALNQFRTSVRKNNLIDTDAFNTSLDIANTYSRDREDMYQDATLSADGSTDYARMNALGYLSTQNSNSGFNLGVSSSQIITSEGLHVTKDRASSYVLIDIEDVRVSEENSEETIERGYVSLDKNGKSNSKFIVYENERIVPLSNYYEYDANFDSESVNLYNSGESKKVIYSHPGTVSYLSPKISRVVSFVTSFNDISDEPIKEVTCEGEGCLEINEMTEGVYRVTVLEGLNFELSSNQQQCLLPYEFTSTNQLNFGQNYCLPIADNNEVQQIEIDEEILSAIFLGAYENSGQLNSAVEKLQSLGYRIIQKDIGKYKAVYIAHKTSNMVDMLASHREEIESIKLLAKRLYKADSISYPVAQVN